MTWQNSATKERHEGGPRDTCWQVTIVACLLTCLASALTRSSGFLYVSIIEEYGTSHEAAAWPIALAAVLNNMAGLFAGPLCQIFGAVPVLHAGSMLMSLGLVACSFAPTITWMAVTMGVLYGSGSGVIFMMLHVLINVNFNKYKGFAIGVMYTGCTISAFLFPRLLLFLKITYGFRGCMLIFGAITMHGTALVLFLKQSIVIQPQIHVKVLEDTSSNCAEPPPHSRMSVIPKSMRHGFTVMKDVTFYVIMTTYVVCNFAFGVFMATIVDFAVDRGATVVQAVNLVPLFSVTDTVGRLGLPLLADRGYLRRGVLAMLNYLLMGMFLLVLPVCFSYAAIAAVCLCTATFIGCSFTLYPALMAEYIGLDRLPIAYGIVGSVAGPLFLLKPTFIGYLRDQTGTYDGAYNVLGSSLILLGGAWFVLVCFERRRTFTWQCNTSEVRSHQSCPSLPARISYVPDFSTNQAPQHYSGQRSV